MIERARHIVLIAAAAQAAFSHPAAPSDPSRRAETGTVEGRVEVQSGAPRRVAERYLSGEAARARTVQALPMIAYIEGAGGSAPRVVRIAQRDTSFAPAVAVVPIGGMVEFPNEDPFFHNVFSYSSPKRFDLGRYPRGETRSVEFDTPGVVKIYCEVHEFMRSVAIVARAPVHATVGEDGRFALRDVPPGRHRLTVWHPEKRSQEVMVEITAGGTTNVHVRFP